MSLTGKTMDFLTIIALLSLMTSCVASYNRQTTPKRYATNDELYPPSVLPTEIPGYVGKATEFEAPFDDVWHAVTVSATQAQWKIHKSVKSKGVILATDPRPKEHQSYGHNEVIAVYAIVVREKGPKVSEVLVMKRGQLDCVYFTTKWSESIGYYIGTLGLGLLVANPRPWENEEKAEACEKKSVVQWLFDSNMEQVLTFTRNNLLAAGAL